MKRRRAAAVGPLPMSDPRTWPSGIRTWFRNAVGDWGPLDIFIFNYGQAAALYLHDALTAAAILEVTSEEWHAEGGYPIFLFDCERIGEIQHLLGIAGYAVHILEPAEQQKQQARKRRYAPVVSITALREKQGEQKL